MVKIRFKFALALATICILPLLAACEREQPGAQTAALPPPQANAVQEAAAQWAAVQGAATDQPYTAAEEAAADELTWQEAYAVFLSELMQVTGLTWRQAYAAILRELAQVPSVGLWVPFGWFFLADIDGTGTPNLIVWHSDVGGQIQTHSAYAFEGGALIQLELGDLLGGGVSMPWDTGIHLVDNGPEHFFEAWLELEDGIFRQRVSRLSRWDGVRSVTTIDGQEVSEDEFRNAFAFLRSSELPPDDRPRMWAMTEENILNVVLGGAWQQAYADLLREFASEFIADEWWLDYYSFLLLDINDTGIPILIVFQVRYQGPFGDIAVPRVAYAFEGGALSPIELGDMPILTSLYMPPGDTGIVAQVIRGSESVTPIFYHWLELEDGGFRQRVSGMGQLRREVEGDRNSPWRNFYEIDGQEVSEDEFFSVFHPWNVVRDNSLPIWRRITERNIQNVVFGVDQPYTAAEEAAAAQLTWRQAYADLLREIATVPDQWGMSPPRDFFLIDIDGTGTPNLIIIEHWAGGEAVIHSAYAFEGGALSQIELVDMPARRVHEFYMPPGDTGIVAMGWGFQFGLFLWLELEDGGFRQRVSGEIVGRLEVEGDWDVWRDFYYIDGQEVSEDEFFSVFHRGRAGIQRGWRLTEDNIQNAVLGG